MIAPRLEDLASNIRRYIDDSAYTPIEVARALGVDKSAVSRWMSGGRTPTVQNLIDLAKLLEIEVADLWNGPEAIPATREQRAVMDRMSRMTPEEQQVFLTLAETYHKR